MTDNDPKDKYQALLRRCLVAFKDIDEMNIVRQRPMVTLPATEMSATNTSNSSLETQLDVKWVSSPSSSPLPTIAPGHSVGVERTQDPPPPPPPPPKKTQVTLSGLLNLLDGIDSKEGHTIIITTNAPKSLDPALFRDGRIDVQIHLGYNTRALLLSPSRAFSRALNAISPARLKCRK